MSSFGAEPAKSGDKKFVIEWFASINCIILLSKIEFYSDTLRCYVALRRRCFLGINVMILISQINDAIANKNAHYKSNELEFGVCGNYNEKPLWKMCVNLRFQILPI